jgi:serine/threonine protein kinase
MTEVQSHAVLPPQVGHWDFGKILGSGSFGTVCLAKNTASGEQYACKVIPKANLRSESSRDHFQRELATAAHLSHVNIVGLHEFFWDDDNYYMILDHCPGGELFDYLAQHGKQTEPIAACVFGQIAAAVAHCHSFGVAHRDLKPENVLITQFPRIKVSDFGLCGFLAPGSLMSTFCGSPCYSSPECLSKMDYDGCASDIWSLGVILYALVTGDLPWHVANTSQMIKNIVAGNFGIPSFVTPKCRELLQGMMTVDPAKRFTIENVLGHPWMDSAKKSKFAMSPSFHLPDLHVPLPSSKPMTEFSIALRRGRNVSNQGIISPFSIDDDDDDREDAAPARLTGRITPSASSGRLKSLSLRATLPPRPGAGPRKQFSFGSGFRDSSDHGR